MVMSEEFSNVSVPPAPHMIGVTVDSGVVNILLEDVASAQYYKFYYSSQNVSQFNPTALKMKTKNFF